MKSKNYSKRRVQSLLHRGAPSFASREIVQVCRFDCGRKGWDLENVIRTCRKDCDITHPRTVFGFSHCLRVFVVNMLDEAHTKTAALSSCRFPTKERPQSAG